MNDTPTQGAVLGRMTLTRPFRLKRVVLAYDGSVASDRALVDAEILAHRFCSEIIVAHVRSPEDAPLDTLTESRRESQFAELDLKELTGRLNAKGLKCHGIMQRGAVGDTLFNLCIKERADLLMLGAYGCGNIDRHTLGSTAEHLLSALPCSAMVYGPNVKFSIDSRERRGPVLLPLSFPNVPAEIDIAIGIARYFNVAIEVLHVADSTGGNHLHRFENECKSVLSLFSRAQVDSTWSVLFGHPSAVIVTRIRELASPFVLMPLKYRHVMAPDHVAARVIRESETPVMTFSVK